MKVTDSSPLPLTGTPTALFLGAGFSKWAIGLPLVSELFDFAVEPWGPRDAEKLELVRALKSAWDLAHHAGDTEPFIADALLGSDRERRSVLWYVGRRLAEPFIYEVHDRGQPHRHTLMIDELMKQRSGGVAKARGVLTAFYSPASTGVITTNYDMLIEYALGSKMFSYGSQGQRLAGSAWPRLAWRDYPLVLRGTVPLAKIHGSISWDQNAYYLDGRRGLTGRALIVAPTPEKRPPPELRYVWELAEGILSRVQRIVVFGFAFNPYDEAVLNLLASSRTGIRSVLLIDTAPQILRAKEIWPAAKITSCPPPPEGWEVIGAWRDGMGG